MNLQWLIPKRIRPDSLCFMNTTIASLLDKIINSRVYDVASETPLALAPMLSAQLGNRVYIKREDMQSIFSFKLRGAYNKMANLSEAQRERGVICASAGNHAQGVAMAARKLGCQALVVMPITTPQVKVAAVREFGKDNVEVVLRGTSYTDAYEYALPLASEQSMTFVHPFDDLDVIAGQGTIAMEILHQHPGAIDAIFVPIGGGGLIAGIGAYVKAVRPEIKVIGVQVADSDAMARSLKSGYRIMLREVGPFSDGTAVRMVGETPFRLAQSVVDDIVIVDNDAICAAIRNMYQDTRTILEPAGALAMAGIKSYVREKTRKGEPVRGETLVAVASGANMDFDSLRFVVDRTIEGGAREAAFA
jgi:threonine dehydratase